MVAAADLVRRGPTGAAPLLALLAPLVSHQREVDGALLAALARIHAHLGAMVEQIQSIQRSASNAERDATVLRQTVDPLVEELQAVPYLAGSPFRTVDSPVGEALGFASPADVGADRESDYVSFEEIFRGPAERVAEEQRHYLPLLEGHAPVLDAGCGRGELLGLLSGAGIEARGVDADAGMVERCRALGLDVVHGEVNAHLESLPPQSLGALFSAQLIEHMPPQELRRMLSLACSRLRPGGLLIAETVNPHRIASLKTFWVDVTHQHPIFPEVALALCAAAGFSSAYVFAPGFPAFEPARFAAPSYAVVATL